MGEPRTLKQPDDDDGDDDGDYIHERYSVYHSVECM
jgi:hypothetical protein